MAGGVMARRAVLFDIDGTLVDTNYLHAVAWAEAFAAHGYDVSMSICHGLIGQGSDRLVTSAVGHHDDAVVDAHSDIYGAQLHRLRAFPQAGELLRMTKQSGLAVVLATSASSHDVGHLRAAIDADDAIDGVTTSDDVEASKPDPDIVQAALDNAKVGADAAVFVGDTVWDVEAAARAGLPCVCVLTGGIAESVLRSAGAVEIYQDAAELMSRFADSALGRLAAR
jgi:HAD superfamily hydrolase (TIGR01509 family)